jgi:hypothetical protein
MQQYPADDWLQMLAESSEEERNDSMRHGTLGREPDYRSHYTKRQDLLDMLVTDPKFAALTSLEYLPHLWESIMAAPYMGYGLLSGIDPVSEVTSGSVEDWVEEMYPRRYSKHTQDAVLAWRPDPWWMPCDSDLRPVTEWLPVYVTFGYEVGEMPIRNSLTLSVYVRLTVSAEGVQQEIY